MIRPWKTWLVFGVCCAVLLAAMGWISVTALRLDDLRQHAAERADLEERVRLALWRLDSWLTPIIVEENARPASAYRAFAPADRAYTKALTQVREGDVLLPSPLLAFNSSNILLHFQLEAGGTLSSPQVPAPSQHALALGGYTTADRITQAANRLTTLQRLLSQAADHDTRNVSKASLRSSSTARDAAVATHAEELFALTASASNFAARIQAPALLVGNNDVRQFEQQQVLRNTAETFNRVNNYRNISQQAFDNNGLANPPAIGEANASIAASGVLQPAWLGQELVLARGVRADTESLVQGVWLNWPGLKTALLDSIKDILPRANLEPVPHANGTQKERTLAALPIRLAPGDIPVESTLVWTPVQTSLAVAWVCVLLAGAAAAFLLQGTLALSERRAAFVSAVTHELRTPLTTFKMYSEMLADGMVTEEAKRKHYLGTLCSEANRLNHLVENVLAYARLERGSARSRLERITLGDLVQRVKPRLVERAAQAGMQVVEDVDEAAARSSVQVDVSVVEQILFNLVDNACKYAAPTANEKLIHLEAVPETGKFALLRVRDHGQGISAEVAKRMFQPFNKSATEAAHSAPGVGLGLALCRRLSRSMGGDLSWDRVSVGGTCFALKLPSV